MRYQVADRSEHSCCYTHSVIDTSWNRPEYNEDRVCECTSYEVAEQIAEALNFSEKYMGEEWAITPSGEIVLA